MILRSGSIQLKLDMKIESLGAGSNDAIPVLNSRQLTSTATIPPGQTALLASEVSRSETRAVQGLPGLSELPGFQSTTNENKEIDTGELLITITPHIVRQGNLQIASRPLLMPYNPNPGTQAVFQEQMPPPPPPPPPASPQTQPQTPNRIYPRNLPPPGGTAPTTPAPQ